MKKIMILAAAAAFVSLISCQKEETITKVSPVFTASINAGTRTTVDVSDGKVAWEVSDEITVTDAGSASAVYGIESIDETTGRATFVYRSGTVLGSGPYTATYGSEPATAQTYSATAGKLYMTAATETNSFTFNVRCGLMRLVLTKAGEKVEKITVTGTPEGGSETTYTLSCYPAVSITTATDFCIALPAGSYNRIEITDSDDGKATLNAASGLGIAVNHIKPVTLGESKLSFVPAPPYLRFTAQQDNSAVIFVNEKLSGYDNINLEYSRDAVTWSDVSNVSGSYSFELPRTGDRIYFRRKSDTPATTFSIFDNQYASFAFEGRIAASGNVMSLVDKSMKSTVLGDYAFLNLFAQSEPSYCLTSAPQLPATTIGEDCYRTMFYNCAGLTSAPQLPATTLASLCYAAMFYGCSSLQTAPELVAGNLATGCYARMFSGCSSLNYIKVRFTDWKAAESSDDDTDNDDTYKWLLDVASTGTFVCPAELATSERGASYIPEGWTIETF